MQIVGRPSAFNVRGASAKLHLQSVADEFKALRAGSGSNEPPNKELGFNYSNLPIKKGGMQLPPILGMHANNMYDMQIIEKTQVIIIYIVTYREEFLSDKHLFRQVKTRLSGVKKSVVFENRFKKNCQTVKEAVMVT